MKYVHRNSSKVPLKQSSWPFFFWGWEVSFEHNGLRDQYVLTHLSFDFAAPHSASETLNELLVWWALEAQVTFTMLVSLSESSTSHLFASPPGTAWEKWALCSATPPSYRETPSGVLPVCESLCGLCRRVGASFLIYACAGESIIPDRWYVACSQAKPQQLCQQSCVHQPASNALVLAYSNVCETKKNKQKKPCGSGIWTVALWVWVCVWFWMTKTEFSAYGIIDKHLPTCFNPASFLVYENRNQGCISSPFRSDPTPKRLFLSLSVASVLHHSSQNCIVSS